MKRTIIYVFGPKRLSKKYYSNGEMILEEGGWLKIGKTSVEDINANKWDVAVSRISQETRTGIPEVCKLYDVFEFPYKDVNVDDEIRKILAEDIYQLETSKHHNRGIEEYEIKAGREFVYGVKRSQLFNAVAKYERDLMLEHYQKDSFEDVIKMVKQNNAIETPFETDSNEFVSSTTPTVVDNDKVLWCNQLWEKVIERLNGLNIKNISNPPGRSYIVVKSSVNHSISYVLSYSVRYDLTYVGIETFNGEEARDVINQFIANNSRLSQIPDWIKKQGSKNKNKWAWLIADTLDKSDDELVEWYINVFTPIYNEFEKGCI